MGDRLTTTGAVVVRSIPRRWSTYPTELLLVVRADRC